MTSKFYGEEQVDVRIVNRLDVAYEDGELAHLVDEYLEGNLPRMYRHLFWPKKVRATGQAQQITPAGEVDRLVDLDMLHAIQRK